MMRRATQAAVTVAITLVGIKLAAHALTGSVSMLSSLVDSILDSAASVVNLLAVRHALSPADREHRFGHGKAEPLAGLAQAVFIGASAVYLVVEAGLRLRTPHGLDLPWIGISVMLVSIALTAALVAYQRRVIAATGSIAVRADYLHYVGDVLVNGGVIVALILSGYYDWPRADPVIALAIAAYIVGNTAAIIRQSVGQLMDSELPESERERIAFIAREHPEVRDMHDLRTRVAGRTTFVQMHLELDGRLPLARAHAISDEVHDAIQREYPNAEILIHEDPAELEEPHRSALGRT
jgi:ferrous-iron efflux pump FieF